MIDRRYGRSCAAVLLGVVGAIGLVRPSLAADGTPSASPPLEPRPALSRETALQPLPAPMQTQPAAPGIAAPAGAKPAAG